MSAYKVVFWDVYGTLIVAERGDLDTMVRRETELRAAFEQVVKTFGLSVPAATLHDLFIRGIAAERQSGLAKGIRHPEVRIDEIWFKLLEKFSRRTPATINLAREVALFFERHANPKKLQPGAFETLTALKQRGLRQGIISNAQFYTPIELSELLRDESVCSICTYESIFDPQLVRFSYELGVAKPDLTAFHQILGALAREGITAGECLFVGDSPANDIVPARAVGFRAMLFASDGEIRQLSQVLELL